MCLLKLSVLWSRSSRPMGLLLLTQDHMKCEISKRYCSWSFYLVSAKFHEDIVCYGGIQVITFLGNWSNLKKKMLLTLKLGVLAVIFMKIWLTRVKIVLVCCKLRHVLLNALCIQPEYGCTHWRKKVSFVTFFTAVEMMFGIYTFLMFFFHGVCSWWCPTVLLTCEKEQHSAPGCSGS